MSSRTPLFFSLANVLFAKNQGRTRKWEEQRGGEIPFAWITLANLICSNVVLIQRSWFDVHPAHCKSLAIVFFFFFPRGHVTHSSELNPLKILNKAGRFWCNRRAKGVVYGKGPNRCSSIDILTSWKTIVWRAFSVEHSQCITLIKLGSYGWTF